jgi:hypothetical protein
MDRKVKGLLSVVILIYLFFIAFVNLDNNPPLWWDEGWTLSVARNWVERGHYGLYLKAEPYSVGLSAAFPVVAPIALSFKLFGVGVWQGRFFGVVFTLCAVGLLGYLAIELYSWKVAIITWGVLFLLYGATMMSPLFWGRQVLGEMPMLFYALAGYALFYLGLTKSHWFFFPTALIFGIAIYSKAQILPFWVISLVFPLLLAVLKGWWAQAKCLGIVFISSLAVYWAMPAIQQWVIGTPLIPSAPLPGLYNVTGFVPVLRVRLTALGMAGFYGTPSIIGLAYSGWQAWRVLKISSVLIDKNPEIIRWSLLFLAGSWIVWYVTLAMWWHRYLFPGVFISSIFLAFLLSVLMSNFNWRQALKNIGRVIKRTDRKNIRVRPYLLDVIRSLTFIFLIFSTILSLLVTLGYAYPSENNAREIAQYLDTLKPSEALIETAESELFFFLHRPYHFPPDNLHIEWNYPSYLGIDRVVEYDPLEYDPEYLVLGHFSEDIHNGIVYGKLVSGPDFKLIAEFPGYKVYKRVREK